MKKTFEFFLHASHRPLGGEPEIYLFTSDMSAFGYIFISKTAVEVEIPEFDIIALEVDGIEKQIAKVRAEAHLKIGQLEQRKQELLAIGYDGSAQ